MTNNSANPQTFAFGYNLGSTVKNGPSLLTSLTDDLNAATTTYSLNPHGSTNVLPTPNAFMPPNASTTVSGSSASIPAAFENGAFTPQLLESGGSTFIGGGNNISAAFSITEGATLSITYDYTAAPPPPAAATPEPSSIVLLGSGVLSLAGLVRRRFTQRA